MPLPVGLKNEIEATAAQLRTDLLTIQPAELAAGDGTGRYWQGQANPAAVPSNGNATALDPGRKPADRGRDWADVGLSQIAGASNAKAQWAVHESEAPGGVLATWIVALLTITPNETHQYVLAVIGTPSYPEGWTEITNAP